MAFAIPIRPVPAIMTAISTMQSLRVHSQTDMAWLSPCR